jgi:hypothetical protein
MRGICGRHRADETARNILAGKLKGDVEILGADGRKVLKRILKKLCVTITMEIGFNWLNNGSSVGLLVTG